MNIVIVGGGTAGWLTALYSKKIFPEHEIILVESKQIGILGAGEASTPHLIQILDFLEIPTSELIKNTNATIKTTAKFTGWSNNSKDFFYHPFQYYNNLLSEQDGYLDSFKTDTNVFHLFSYLKNISTDEYCLINKLCNNNLVPFTKTSNFTNFDPIQNYTQIGGWSLNFDAKLLAEYFSTIGEKRKIKKVEGKIQEIFLNDKEEISSLLLEDGASINCDFVFDCTGFARLLIGKKYSSKWISYKEYLPTNKALPFFLDIDKEKEIPPYIEAIAMDYGWMWKTPLQNRYGCGYVYDSNYLSDEDAKKEIEEYLGFEPIYPRKDKGAFNFEAGCFEEIWIKNCLAVGLSSGFIEPLEATSIMQTVIILQRFMSEKENFVTKNNLIKQKFNKMFINETEEIVNFLYLHYITNKNNSIFWKNFTKNNKMPKFCKYIVKVCNDKPLTHSFDFDEQKIFGILSYYYILLGNKIIKKNKMLAQTNNFYDLNKKIKEYNIIVNNQLTTTLSCIKHAKFIDYLKE